MVNYNDPATIYHKYCGHGTVLAYANEFLPDGVTTTTDFLSLYSSINYSESHGGI